MSANIAMWSGPRNISTAMMYSFGNRPDCIAWDEPFYAFSLVHHGNDHPMRDEIIAADPSGWDSLVAKCLAPAPKPVFYQKHMTHHMLPSFRRDWIAHPEVVNAFLIREPERVLVSYTKQWSDVTLEEIGVPQQIAIFDQVAQRLGRAPPVIDTADVLADPRGILTALCAATAIPFSEAMLHWPAGRRASDGVWAPVWYKTVEASTGFAPAETRPTPKLDGALARIADEARPHYLRLKQYCLRAA